MFLSKIRRKALLFAKKTAIINVLILRRTLITLRCLYAIIQHFSKEINRRKNKKIIFVKFSFSRPTVPELRLFSSSGVSPSYGRFFRRRYSSLSEPLAARLRAPILSFHLKRATKRTARTEYKNLPTGAVPCLSVPFQKITPKTITR